MTLNYSLTKKKEQRGNNFMQFRKFIVYVIQSNQMQLNIKIN